MIDIRRMPGEDDANGFRVAIVEALWVWVRRRLRTDCREMEEVDEELGISTMDILGTDTKSRLHFAGYEDYGPDWRTREFVLAGKGEWCLPEPTHPDFLAERPPEQGELFNAETCLLWLSPDRLVQIDGGYALSLLADRHGEVIGDLEEFLQARAFDDALDILLGDYGHAPSGEGESQIVNRLSRLIAKTDLLRAGESIVLVLASRVHEEILDQQQYEDQ